MSTTYNARGGETYEIVARRVYGLDDQASRIARANPGIPEPLVAGQVIVVPFVPGLPTNKELQAPSDNVSEASVLIEGKNFRFWDSITITRAIDTFDTMEFTAPFEPTDRALRDTFRPFTYKSAAFKVGGETLFTGTMVGIMPELTNRSRSVIASGYSLPGVLNDCTMPPSSFDLEYSDQTLDQIAKTMAGTFGIDVVIEGGAPTGAALGRVSCDPTKKVYSFLIDLAKQQNLVIGSTVNGALAFRQTAPVGRPRARLSEGLAPLDSVTPLFNPQTYYSDVTGLESVFMGSAGERFPAKNERLKGVVRPFNFKVKDVIGGDVKGAALAKRGRMFASMASYTCTVNTWRDPSGRLWEPNTTVNLQAPGAMVYNEFSFIVRSVIFERTKDSERATLDLIIPGSFSGVLPEVLPWED